MNLGAKARMLLLSSCVACAGPPVVGPGSTLPKPTGTTAAPEGAFVTANAGATVNEATAAANEAVRLQFFGQTTPHPSLQTALEAHLHVEVLDVNPTHAQARAWVDTLALQAYVADRLQSGPSSPEPASPLVSTEGLQAARRVLDDATLQAAWCALYVRTGGPACPDDGRVDRMRLAISQAAQGVRIRVLPEQGTPYKLGHPAFRPLLIEAISGSPEAPLPWAQLPLRLQGPPDLLAAYAGVTDAQGRWEVPWQRVLHPNDIVTVQVDTQTLLGEAHAALWNASPVAVKTKALTWKTARLLVVLKSSTNPRDPLVEVARDRLLQSLNQQLPGTTLAFSSASYDKSALTQLTATGHDVLAQADISWAFASALGGRSVWYEARATFELFNNWNEEALLSTQAMVQEAGIGDAHAAKQAVGKLAAELARQLTQTLRIALPDVL